MCVMLEPKNNTLVSWDSAGANGGYRVWTYHNVEQEPDRRRQVADVRSQQARDAVLRLMQMPDSKV